MIVFSNPIWKKMQQTTVRCCCVRIHRNLTKLLFDGSFITQHLQMSRSYAQLINEAIVALNKRKGSSPQSIKKQISIEYPDIVLRKVFSLETNLLSGLTFNRHTLEPH
jgi:hypothetical protein